MGSERKLSNSRRYCSVYGCQSYKTGTKSLHYFPKQKVQRGRWASALSIGKRVTRYMTVCSLHFREDDFFPQRVLPIDNSRMVRKLKRNAVPSLNLPEKSVKKRLCAVYEQQKFKREERSKRRMQIKSTHLQEHALQRGSLENVQNHEEHSQPCPSSANIDKNSRNDNQLSTVEAANILLELRSQNVSSDCQKSFEDKVVQVETAAVEGNFSLSKLLVTEKDLFIFTGISSFELLNSLVVCAEKLLEVNSNLTHYFSVSLKERIILTRCKLKLNLSYECLSVLFSITPHTCNNYFRSTCQLLAQILSAAIVWPDKKEILANYPTCFKKFKNVRLVIDCTELFVERSKCLKCRICTYSHYKGGNTVKFMVGLAPSGLITFVSKCYGGKASDKAIFIQSGVLDQLEPQDAIMVDKGFLIEEKCRRMGVTLISPPFLRHKSSLSKEEALITADNAKARVHVERVIRKMKLFNILSGRLTWSMLPYCDNLLTIIAGLVNLSKPVLAEERY